MINLSVLDHKKKQSNEVGEKHTKTTLDLVLKKILMATKITEPDEITFTPFYLP